MKNEIIISIAKELNIDIQEVEQLIKDYSEKSVQDELIEISSVNLENEIDEPLRLLKEKLNKQIIDRDTKIVKAPINEKKASSFEKKNQKIKKENINNIEILLAKQLESFNIISDLIIEEKEKDTNKYEMLHNAIHILDKKIESKNTKFNLLNNSQGYLIIILCLMFYVLGSTSYYFLDAITYSKFHSYLLTTIVPIFIVGIIFGVIIKPIILKIITKRKLDSCEK
jgi:hypothetical protein